MGISTKFTHADLLAMPEDNRRREILDGELIVSPTPKLLHQDIVLRLAVAFCRYLEEHPIGRVFASPLDVIFTELDVLEPDLIFVLEEHRHILQDWIRGTPDLVIEVLSPSSVWRDRGPKLRAYARFGVPEYWIADPDARAIELYRLGKEEYESPRIFLEQETLTSPVIPGFILPVGKVFESD